MMRNQFRLVFEISFYNSNNRNQTIQESKQSSIGVYI